MLRRGRLSTEMLSNMAKVIWLMGRHQKEDNHQHCFLKIRLIVFMNYPFLFPTKVIAGAWCLCCEPTTPGGYFSVLPPFFYLVGQSEIERGKGRQRGRKKHLKCCFTTRDAFPFPAVGGWRLDLGPCTLCALSQCH